MTKIKICGLHRPCDIEYVYKARPAWCGFIINFLRNHRSLSPDQVRALGRKLDGAVVSVGAVVDQPVETVAELLKDRTIPAAQLCGHENAFYIAALRSAAPRRPSAGPWLGA